MRGRRLGLYLLMACLVVLVACNNSDNDHNNGPDTGDNSGGSTVDTFLIEPGDQATYDAIAAFIAAGPGDTIRFGCGFFQFEEGLVLQNTEGVTIDGCGRDKTVLSFADSTTPVGILVSNVDGITIQQLTVIDTPGDGIKTKSANIVTLRDVRAMWSSADQQVTADNYQTAMSFNCPTLASQGFHYVSDSSNGRYGIYPVQSSNVLLDNVEAIGASDAAIYVGQSDDVIIRNSHAIYSVAGFELENIQRGDMYDNIAECNTFGFLIYDLPGLNQYGNQVRMFDNTANNNNFPNFAAGGMVATAPRGIGLLTLGFDNIEVFGNTFNNHKTAGIVITSYELIGPPNDKRLDMYNEGLNIHNNIFNNNGFEPLIDLQGALQQKPRALLSALIALKNGGTGAHILWDGLYDEPHTSCPYPTTASGEPVPNNAQGKPIYQTGLGADPSCRYNLYKFDDAGERIKPEMFICIEHNTFQKNSPTYANFHGDSGAQALLGAIAGSGGLPSLLEIRQIIQGLIADGVTGLVASRDMSPHQCRQRYGATLQPLPAVTLDTYTLPEGGGNEPTDAEIKALCTQDTGGKINYEALARVNCPLLSQYHLFEDPADPSRNPNGHSVGYDLNTKLFSDYAVKHRFVFMPPGETAQWPETPKDNPGATLVFPVGTVISKTFSFPNEVEGTVNHVETRLLIKRQDEDGSVHWKGLPYIWTQENGKPVAKLSLGGGEAAVSWRYTDDEGDIIEGSTDSYAIPNASQCITCHANDHRPAGSPPIGPKPRNMNKRYSYAGGTFNQLDYWTKHGFLSDTPPLRVNQATLFAEAIPRIPDFDDPGSSGEPAGSYADLEARARGWLAVNCSFCHNPGGMASNTGLFLDWFGPVDSHFGICKTPTAAGSGSGGRPYDIYPGDASQSILPYRINSNEPEVQMPPIARSTVHEQALALIRNWINTMTPDDVVDASCVPGG